MSEKSNLQESIEFAQTLAQEMTRHKVPSVELRTAAISSIPSETAKAVKALAETIAEVAKPSPAIMALQRSIVEQQAAASKLFSSFARMDISPVVAGFAEATARFEAQKAPFAEMTRNFEAISRSFAATVDRDAVSKWSAGLLDFFARVEKSHRTLPTRTRKAVAALSRHGWFFDLDMPVSSLWRLEEAIEDGMVDAAEEALCSYYGEQAPKIVQRLKERYPQRARVLASALAAHEAGQYELAIPVFLAQADGICQQIVHVQLCQVKKHKAKVIARVEKALGDTMWKALLFPFTEGSPLTMNERERQSDFTGLNRHQVLHGQVSDYGTRVNSLKAIALINYVSILSSTKGNAPRCRSDGADGAARRSGLLH